MLSPGPGTENELLWLEVHNLHLSRQILQKMRSIPAKLTFKAPAASSSDRLVE